MYYEFLLVEPCPLILITHWSGTSVLEWGCVDQHSFKNHKIIKNVLNKPENRRSKFKLFFTKIYTKSKTDNSSQ